MHLQGRVVVVTGASRGIGRATAYALARRGATVVVSGLDAAALDDLAAEIGGSAMALDVREPDHAASLVATTLERHGRVDAVVANAGVGHYGSFADMSRDRIEELLEVNVRAPILLARAVLPELLARGEGVVVFLSSIVAAVPVPAEAVYSATKASIESFAESLREHVRGTGVHVGTVLPGVVRTEFFDRRGAAYDRRFPRPIAPERVADAVLRIVEDGRDRVVVPPWLAVPMRLRGIAPGAFRALSRRYG